MESRALSDVTAIVLCNQLSFMASVLENCPLKVDYISLHQLSAALMMYTGSHNF